MKANSDNLYNENENMSTNSVNLDNDNVNVNADEIPIYTIVYSADNSEAYSEEGYE